MPETRKKWSFRRWRRRWNDRRAALTLRWRIWFDRHILSHETRRSWRRRWDRRSRRIGQVVENAGYKVLPNRPNAAPDTSWTRLLKHANDIVSRVYPPDIRRQHAREFRAVWHQLSAPFRHANHRIGSWLADFLLPAFTPIGFRKTFFNWKGAAGAILAVALLSSVFLWLVPGWRSHNGTKWAAQARLLLNRGYQLMAFQTALRAFQQNARNEEAARVLADISERQGFSDALNWRHRVVACANSTTNQLSLASTALKFEPPPYPTTSRILSSISGAAANLPQYHVVAAQYEARNGRWTPAEDHYLAALTREPANTDVELALALLRLQTRNPAKIDRAQTTLASLSLQTNIAVRALRSLVTVSAERGDFETAVQYSTRLLAQESSTFEDRMVHLELLTRKRDPECAIFLNTLQEQVSANPVFIAQLGVWMSTHKQSTNARLWFSRLPPTIQRSDAVLLASADIYANDSDWAGMEQFLLKQSTQRGDSRGWGTIEFVRQALLARAYRGLGERRACAENFNRAKELASGMSQRLASLTRLVLTWGWDAEVEDLLWTMFERYPDETWAADTLLKEYRTRNNTDGIRRVFALQLKHSPNDSLLKNNLAMTLLLQKVDLPTAHRLALESHQQNPDSAINTSTYAYSLLLQDQPVESRKAMEALGTNVLKVPSIAAYYAIITAANGDKKTARQYLDLARQADLLPEEKTLLDGVRKRL